MKTLLRALLFLLSCGVAAATSADIHVVELRGIIHPVSASYLEDAIDRADASGAAALVIEMDTPGGLVDSTKEIVQKIFAAKTPVIGFVAPSGARAASGGFYLLIACDAAVMAPGTNTGAAHPVTAGGENTKDNIEIQKAESDLAAFARSTAENRGRNVQLAESAVTKSVSWTETEALKGNLIDAIAKDLPELVKTLDGRKVKRMGGGELVLDLKGRIVPSRGMSATERFQDFLLTPTVALFLLGIGILGVYIEFTHPGLILPGAVGAVSFLLFAYAAHILPVNVLALGLIAAAVVLFVLEIKIVSHGLLGLGGAVALVVGSLLLFQGGIPELRVPPLVVLPVSITIAVIMFGIVRLVVRARRASVTTGREGMVGEIGVAMTDIAPEGRIFVHGEYWNARADVSVPRGSKVRILSVEEMHVVVEPEGRQS